MHDLGTVEWICANICKSLRFEREIIENRVSRAVPNDMQWMVSIVCEYACMNPHVMEYFFAIKKLNVYVDCSEFDHLIKWDVIICEPGDDSLPWCIHDDACACEEIKMLEMTVRIEPSDMKTPYESRCISALLLYRQIFEDWTTDDASIPTINDCMLRLIHPIRDCKEYEKRVLAKMRCAIIRDAMRAKYLK